MKSHPIQNAALMRSILFERWQWRALVLGLSFVAAVFGLCAPFAQKSFIDGLLAGAPESHWVVGAFFLTLASQWLLQLAIWLATRESYISQKSLGQATYRRMLAGPGALIGRRPAGEAVSLFAVDIPGASLVLADTLAMCASMAFPVLIAPIALHFYFQIPWAASIGALGFLFAIHGILAVRQSRFFLKFKALAAERTGLVSEWVQNIRTLRILGWIGAAEDRIFDARRRETANRKAMVANGQFMNSVAGSSMFVLNILAVLWVFRAREAQGAPPPSAGELLSLLWILGVFLARPLRQLPWVFVISMDAITSTQRLQKALGLPIAQPRVEGSLQPSARAGFALEVRGLNLEAADDSGPRSLLKDIDLALKPAELVAVVGEVGSGKSLLLQSLIGATGARFERFALDGKDTEGPALREVRQHFAFVPQEGFTMSATLRENVVFEYRAQADAPVVLGALRAAQFVPERERVVDGLETEIGERGVNLSGGQRQRIGLARARFAERSIVLMDDCLSAVDVDTERRLLDELICGDWKDRARLLVTHRMSVLPKCDRILFMEDGAISLQGTYAQLLKGSAKFRDFIRRETEREVEGGAPHA